MGIGNSRLDLFCSERPLDFGRSFLRVGLGLRHIESSPPVLRSKNESFSDRRGILLKIFRWGWVAIAALAAAGAYADAQDADAPARANTVWVDPANLRPVPRKWEMGPFVDYGNGLLDRTDYHFFMAGFQVGKVLTPMVHAGAFSGRFEFGGNVMPLFQAYTPAPHSVVVTSNGTITTENYGGGTFTGVSVTPVVFRWNFGDEHKRVLPWFQAQAGAVWTNHKFPPDIEVTEGTPGGTSVWNFRSGAGVGAHYFTDPRHSIDLAVNAEHISSASLGDHNPGVNATIQVLVGYTWWK